MIKIQFAKHIDAFGYFYGELRTLSLQLENHLRRDDSVINDISSLMVARVTYVLYEGGSRSVRV